MMAHVRCNDDAVVFDMDSVLLDTEPRYMRAMQKTAVSFGYKITDQLLLELIVRNGDESRRRLSAKLGGGFPIDEFSRLWPVTWPGMVATEGIARKPGVIEILTFLKEQVLMHAIATLSVAEHAERSLRAAGLLEHVSVRVTGEQASRNKPAPDIYLEAVRRFDVPPPRCFAFKDSELGLEAATQLA